MNLNSEESTAAQVVSIEPKPARMHRRKLYFSVLTAIIFLIFAVWLIYYLSIQRHYQSTDNAYVSGDIIPVTPRIYGTITRITVEVGDFVHKGDLLIQLNESETLISLQNAKANLAQTVRTQQHSTGLSEEADITELPEVKAATAQLAQAYLNHKNTQVISPISGYVAARNVQPGEYVNQGHTLLSIVPLDQVWVEANFKENQISQMRIGQPVDIITSLYGNQVHYKGTIKSFGIGTGSVFSLLPAQNATGNWIKIVQRIPVRIALEPYSFEQYPLRLGLSCKVTVDLRQKDGSRLTQHAISPSYLATSVFEQELDDVNALIAQIIHENIH